MSRLAFAAFAAACLPALASAAPQISVADPYAIAAPGQSASAYLRLTNLGDTTDLLNEVSSDAGGRIEIHAFMMDGDSGVRMIPVNGIEIPPGFPVVLAPSGLHLMLVDLEAPLEAGSEITVTLGFETSDDIEISVPVLDAEMLLGVPATASEQ